MSDYSFLATGIRDTRNDDVESMLHVQAAVMVFLDDAMALGHLCSAAGRSTTGTCSRLKRTKKLRADRAESKSDARHGS